MKTIPILLPVLLGALASCASSTTGNPELQGRGSMWAGDAIRNASMNNAIIAQHTLFPYHFANGSSELNDLGERDLSVLAGHFKDVSGDLNVRRGGASESLYEARVKAVLARLAEAGVPGGAVSVQDAPPGGAGMPSERVIVILKEKMSKGSSTGATASTTSVSTGGGVLQ